MLLKMTFKIKGLIPECFGFFWIREHSGIAQVSTVTDVLFLWSVCIDASVLSSREAPQGTNSPNHSIRWFPTRGQTPLKGQQINLKEVVRRRMREREEKTEFDTQICF